MERPLNPRASIINRSPLELKRMTLSLINLLLQASVLILISEISLNASSVYDDKNTDLNMKSYSKDEFLKVIITFIVIYVVYIGFALFSAEFKLILKIKETQSIFEKLKAYIEKPIKITLNTFSFKYVSEPKSFKKFKKGKMKKIISYFEKEKLNFLSCRDITGPIDLDSEHLSKSNKRIWINLKLKLEYEIADDLSFKDINTQKDFIISRNRKKDIHMDFFEEKSISQFEPNVIVHQGEEENFFINKYFYLLFTFIIPVIEIYKIYLNSKIKYYELTIRKVISTRYNLKEPEFDGKYAFKDPKLISKEKEQKFENFAFLNQRIYENPTIEEIKSARIINENLIKKIRDYNIHFGISPEELEEPLDDSGELSSKIEKTQKVIVKEQTEIQLSEQVVDLQPKIEEKIEEKIDEKNPNEFSDLDKEFKPPIRSYSTNDSINNDVELMVVNLNEIKPQELEKKLIQ